MDKRQVRAWVRAWADVYPEKMDEPLVALDGRDHFDRDAMDVVIGWKFITMAHRRANARRYLRGESEARIEDLTRRAFGCGDDLGALLIVDVLPGVGAALGSSILMANDPDRYTVMDTRSLKSLRALGLFSSRWSDANEREWLDYLAACRSLRDATDESLRRVDRALYSADGKPGMPS